MARRKRKRGYSAVSAKPSKGTFPAVGRYGISAMKPGHARKIRTQAVANITNIEHLPDDAQVSARVIGDYVQIREARYKR